MGKERIPWKMDPQGRAPGNNIACCGKFYKRVVVTHHPDGEYSVFALEQQFQIQPCNSPSLPFTKRKGSAELSQLQLFWASSLFAWTWSASLSLENGKGGGRKQLSSRQVHKTFCLAGLVADTPHLRRKVFAPTFNATFLSWSSLAEPLSRL